MVAAAGGGHLAVVHLAGLLRRQHASIAQVEGHAVALAGARLGRRGAAEQLADAVLDGGHHALVHARPRLDLLYLLFILAADVEARAFAGRAEPV